MCSTPFAISLGEPAILVTAVIPNTRGLLWDTGRDGVRVNRLSCMFLLFDRGYYQAGYSYGAAHRRGSLKSDKCGGRDKQVRLSKTFLNRFCDPSGREALR